MKIPIRAGTATEDMIRSRVLETIRAHSSANVGTPVRIAVRVTRESPQCALSVLVVEVGIHTNSTYWRETTSTQRAELCAAINVDLKHWLVIDSVDTRLLVAAPAPFEEPLSHPEE